MFTVKVRDNNVIGGPERLYSAQKIEVIYPGPSELVAGATNWDKSGIYLDPEAKYIPESECVPEQFLLTAKDIILFGGEHSEAAKRRKGGKVWVMNEQGATVATYDL